MKNNLTTTNQNAKLSLSKSKSLLNITNSLLENHLNKELIENFENFRFSSALGHGGDVNSVVITQNEKFLVSGSSDKTIKLWELSSGKEVRTFEGHSSSVNSVVISADGKYIISGSTDKTVHTDPLTE
jgi:WD40 repeat protein